MRSLASSQETDNYSLENELDIRFDPYRLSALGEKYLEQGVGFDISEMIGERKFVVGIVPATSEFADLAKSVETIRFAKQFKRSKSEVYREYEKTDEDSLLIFTLDVQGCETKPAGALRMIGYSDGKLQKSIQDLVVDDVDNPWIDEIKELHFANGETYDQNVAWKRLCKSIGVELKPEESYDVATVANHEEYSSNGSIDGVSLSLYHTCLRLALASNIKNLVSIQDIRPLGILQSFGDPFDTFPGLNPHPYGGPYDTIPAVSFLEDGMQRIRDNDEFMGSVFIDGLGLSDEFLLPDEYLPHYFSNRAVGLTEVTN